MRVAISLGITEQAPEVDCSIAVSEETEFRTFTIRKGYSKSRLSRHAAEPVAGSTRDILGRYRVVMCKTLATPWR